MADSRPLTLSSAEFEQYATNWVQLVTQGSSDLAPLNDSFATPNGRRQYFSMPADWVRWLISTVGCTQVKARFLLNEDGKFNLALYATDAQNSRVSAYYLLNSESTELGNMPASTDDLDSPDSDAVSSGDEDSDSVQIPHGVAGHWIKHWRDADKITSAMFATRYSFLQGYNFQRGDLMDNLFNVVPHEYQQLRVDFGLHKYYAHYDNDDPQPTYTFGLILRLVNPDATAFTDAADNFSAASDGSDTPFYDMSTPVPPGY